jgi:hypothetical protein
MTITVGVVVVTVDILRASSANNGYCPHVSTCPTQLGMVYQAASALTMRSK